MRGPGFKSLRRHHFLRSNRVPAGNSVGQVWDRCFAAPSATSIPSGWRVFPDRPALSSWGFIASGNAGQAAVQAAGAAFVRRRLSPPQAPGRGPDDRRLPRRPPRVRLRRAQRAIRRGLHAARTHGAEPGVAALLDTYMTGGRVFFDVGANWGYLSYTRRRCPAIRARSTPSSRCRRRTAIGSGRGRTRPRRADRLP